MEMKFYRCRICGQIIAVVKSTGNPVICCGEPMQELVPGTVDASLEKHVPVYEIKDGIVCVKVGTVEHPSTKEHHIEWIAIQTKHGNQRVELENGAAPEACFSILDGDEPVAVYAYCNLHGLWRS